MRHGQLAGEPIGGQIDARQHPGHTDCNADWAACPSGLGAGATPTTTANADSGTSGTASSATTTLDDVTLTTKVKAALLAKSEFNSTAISVNANSGMVTLAGKLPPQQIAQAEQTARGVDGVRGVVNNLMPAGEPGSSG